MSKISTEVHEATEGTYRPLRIKVGREIARRFAREVLVQIERMEKDIFAQLQKIANRRGESAPSFRTFIQQTRAEKRLSEPDLLGALGEALKYLDIEETEAFAAIFGKYSTEVQAIFEARLAESYQAFLDYTYQEMKKSARPQNPARFAEIPETYTLNANSPIYRGFINEGLKKVSNRLSVQYQIDVYQAIQEGLTSGAGWSSIAGNIHSRVGLGASWHWQRLVRTEMQAAYGLAARDRGEKAGVDYEYLSVSRSACPICTGKKGYYAFNQGPRLPIHPNCRCSLIFYFNLPKGAVLG